jgi:riboflavin-specific deaminase-like protein
VKRPFVTANFALTADGRISTRNFTPADFSSPRDKRRLLEIRATCDAILAGAKTIAADNMSMGLPAADLRAARRARGKPEYPTRVLLTNSGRLSPTLRVFTKDFSPIVVFSTKKMPRAVRAALAKKATLHLDPAPQVDLAAMLATLRREHGVRRLVCEGGAQIFRALLVADLIDELNLTLCPRVFGGKKAPTLTGPAGDYLARSTRLRLLEFRPVEDECFLRYRVDA